MLRKDVMTCEEFEDELSCGYITVKCPYCDEYRRIEPDGSYDAIECEECHKHYKTEGVC